MGIGRKIRKSKSLTLVEVIVVTSIIALISTFSIINVIALKRTANEAAAKANIRTLSTAAETLMASTGHYPTTLAEFQGSLVTAGNFCADASGTTTMVQGYDYSCTMDATGYTFVASPFNSGMTGNITYTATTGCILTPL